ncbi:hypothetical protein ACQKGO_32825 [Corallococcus interemptor]|uniref:hypothetical protein n=1 Tax=Corallococcus interemptor TaxID=2316720 RepID=UPI003D003150
MAYNSNFDVDAVMGVLGTTGERFQDGTPEDEALRIAAVALLYVRENGQLDDYRDCFRKFFGGSRRLARAGTGGTRVIWFVSPERASGSFHAGRAAG